MQFTIDKSELLEGIKVVEKAVPNRTTMPILLCFRLLADGNGLKISASDAETSIETTVSAFVAESGIVAIDAKTFSQIVSKMPDGNIECTLADSNVLYLKNGKAKVKIAGRDGEDFPISPSADNGVSFELDSKEFVNAINKTLFCIKKEDNGMMGGGNIVVSGSKITVTGLDGYKIARHTFDTESAEETNIIVPYRCLLNVIRIANEKTIRMTVAGNLVVFETETTRLVSSLIGGTYYNLDSMMKLDFENVVSVNKDELIGTLDRILTFTATSKKPAIFNISGDLMTVTVEGSMGGIKDDFDIIHSGEDLKIAFNPEYIINVLRRIEEETATIEMVNDKSPCQMKDGNSEFIVLPVNVRG